MKNILKKLGIRIGELCQLLFVPEQTLHTWFTRQSTIPSAHYRYILGLELYQQQQKEEDLKTMYTQWETSNRALLETQKTKALWALQVNDQKNNWTLDQLKQKETRLLQRLHLSEHYPTFLWICKIQKTYSRGAAYYPAGVLLILAVPDSLFKN